MTSTKHVCPGCGHPYRLGTLFCDDCGATLPTVDADDEPESFADETRSGLTEFAQDATLVFRVEDVAEPIRLQIPDRVVLGRVDRDGPIPDLDLTDYDAVDNGVSRVHASIQRDGDSLYLSDIDSTNGTFLNGQRLGDDPQLLHDGDTIRLGHLSMKIGFR